MLALKPHFGWGNEKRNFLAFGPFMVFLGAAGGRPVNRRANGAAVTASVLGVAANVASAYWMA